MAELSFTVNEKGTIGLDPLEPPPTQGPALDPTRERSETALPRPLRDTGKEKQDAMRRPQAALLFRALKAAGSAGLSWKECWALSDDEEFTVGPIVIWMRYHGCEVNAVYDLIAGETRFYLVGWNAQGSGVAEPSSMASGS
jgi:hypothetical protein